MKTGIRVYAIVVLVLMLLGLYACSKQEPIYTVTKNGMEFVVNMDNCTISDGTHTYGYQYAGTSQSYEITVTYPDGSTYWYSQYGSAGQGGWSNDYNEDAFVDGGTLCEVVMSSAPKKIDAGKIIGAAFLVLLGAFDLVFPKAAWHVSYGWRYKNAEPSDIALTLARVGGVIVIIAGAVLMVS